MPDDMYPDDGPDEKSPEPSPDKPESKDDDKDTKDEAHTELVGKKLLDMDEDKTIKPGTTCTFKVIKDWGDSVEIAYVKKDKKDKEDSDDEEKSADDEIDEIEASSMKG